MSLNLSLMLGALEEAEDESSDRFGGRGQSSTPTPEDKTKQPDSKPGVEYLTVQSIASLKRAFVDLCDKNGNGYITPEEFDMLIESLFGYTNGSETRNLINKVDASGTGTYRIDECLHDLMQACKDFKDRFEVITAKYLEVVTDGNRPTDPGSVSALRDALQQMAGELTVDEVNDIIRVAEVDGDGDGQINDEMFLKEETDRLTLSL